MITSVFRFSGALCAGLIWATGDAAAQGPFESTPEDAVQIQIVATGNNNGELEECG